MYKAEGLSVRFAADPQMAVPRRPRFSEDYVFAPIDADGFVVVGGERHELFRGRSARALLPRLLPLLDGTRTASELAVQLPGLRAEVLSDALALLFMRGLLEEGETEADRAEFGDAEREAWSAQLRFFGRFTDVNRLAKNRFGTQRRLRQADVAILADDAFSLAIARRLAQAGTGSIAILAPGNEDAVQELAASNPLVRVSALDRAGDSTACSSGRTLVVAVTADEKRARWEELDATCRARSVPWVRVVLHRDSIEVGPRFAPVETACYRCASYVLSSREEPARSSPPLSALGLRAAADYASLVLLMELSGLFSPMLANRARRFDPAGAELQERRVFRLPRCPVCGLGDPESRPLRLPEDLAAIFHLETNHKWDGLAPKSHQVHYSAHVSDVASGAYKTYPTMRKLSLPPLASLPPLSLDLVDAIRGGGVAGARRERISIADVARLCGWSAGWRAPEGSLPFRWAPSGGGLCSSDLYVLSWDVEGIAPGVYHYAGKSHQLEVLSQGDPHAALAPLLEPTRHVPGAGLAVALTSQHTRLLSKYGARSYRYTHLDAGVMAQAITLIANALALRTAGVARFADDELATLLGVPARQEFPTHVLLIGNAA